MSKKKKIYTGTQTLTFEVPNELAMLFEDVVGISDDRDPDKEVTELDIFESMVMDKATAVFGEKGLKMCLSYNKRGEDSNKSIAVSKGYEII